MNTTISPLLSQPELFPVSVMAQHGCLLPTTSGLTPYAQRTIRRAMNLLDKYLRQPGIAFTSSTAARDWLRLHLARQEREVFMVLYLDNQHRLLESETLFAGSVNHVQVHSREVVKSAFVSMPQLSCWRITIPPVIRSPANAIATLRAGLKKR